MRREWYRTGFQAAFLTPWHDYRREGIRTRNYLNCNRWKP